MLYNVWRNIGSQAHLGGIENSHNFDLTVQSEILDICQYHNYLAGASYLWQQFYKPN